MERMTTSPFFFYSIFVLFWVNGLTTVGQHLNQGQICLTSESTAITLS